MPQGQNELLNSKSSTNKQPRSTLIFFVLNFLVQVEVCDRAPLPLLNFIKFISSWIQLKSHLRNTSTAISSIHPFSRPWALGNSKLFLIALCSVQVSEHWIDYLTLLRLICTKCPGRHRDLRWQGLLELCSRAKRASSGFSRILLISCLAGLPYFGL